MNLVIELLGMLTEAEEGTARQFELEELVKTFKNKKEIEKHVNKLWGSKHLTYKGQEFFKGDDLGPIYKKGMKVAEKLLMKDEHEVEVMVGRRPAELMVKLKEVTEVYLGYSVEQDKLYMGFDCWVDEDALEQDFDEIYNEIFDEDFDVNNPEHLAVWNTFKKDNKFFYGGLVELTMSDTGSFDGDVMFMQEGGFYKEFHGSSTFKALKLIDLRLD